MVAFGPFWEEGNTLPALGILAIYADKGNNQKVSAKVITLRHRQALKKNSLFRERCWIKNEIDLSLNNLDESEAVRESFFFQESDKI